MLGTTVSHYRIVGHLGDHTFEADDVRLGRRVALQLMPEDMATDQAAVERFKSRTQVAATVNHPNICTVYDSALWNGRPFLVMELAAGQSLQRRLQGCPLPLEQVVQLGQQALDALEAAHGCGAIHGNLNPSSFIIGASNELKLIGLASLPAASRGEELDVATDLHDLGQILYEMATGTPPGSDPNRPVPETLRAVLQRALDRDPGRRYPNAAEMRAALMQSHPVAKKIPCSKTNVPGRSGRKRFVAALVTGASAVALLMGTVTGFQEDTLTGSQGNSQLKTATSPKSVAVLPFLNASNDTDDDYLGEGISEEIINQLTKNNRLRVAARTSSFSFKDPRIETSEIARRLNVDYVLKGSVRKAGDSLQITTQLTEAKEGEDLWSEAYSLTLRDLLSIQDEIAETVVQQLELSLLDPKPKSRRPKPEAYLLLLRAREAGRHGTPESSNEAKRLYEKAIATDPNYADAWAHLASLTINRSRFGLESSGGRQRALEMINRALELEPESALAHSVMGGLLANSNFEVSARHFERSLAIEPNYLGALHNSAFLLISIGRLKQAISFQEYVTARDPLNSQAHHNLGWFYRLDGRFDDAIASYRNALNFDPSRICAHYGIAQSLLLKGEAEKALEAAQKEPFEPCRLTGLAMAYFALGQHEQSDAALDAMKAQTSWEPFVAMIHAFRNEPDQAFELLYQIVDGEILTENLFANLHNDPRWISYLESIGLGQERLDSIQFNIKLPE